MKRVGKVIFYIFLTFFLLIVVLILVAAFAENKIAKIAVEQVGKTTNIPVQVDKIEFSLVHNFPFATIQCNNILVSSPSANFVGKQDTLAFAGRLYVSVEAKPLLKSIFKIRKIEIENAEFFYKVDSTGKSNLDFLADTTQQEVVDTSANAIFLNVKEFNVKHTVCYYQDKKIKASAEMLIEQLDLSGLINKNQYIGEAEGKAYLSNCSFDSTNLYLMKQAALDFKAKYEAGMLTINRADVNIDNEVKLAINGTINPGDSLSTNMTIKAEKLDLGGISKYVPEIIFQKYGIRKFSGLLDADATYFRVNNMIL